MPKIWREEESNRILWNQSIPHLYDNNNNSNYDTNISNSIENIFHIESQVLDRNSAYFMSQRVTSMDLQSDNVSEEQTQPNKQTKTKIRSSTFIDNTSKRKANLEKLIKDTNKLAPINPSLSQ
ncbi:21355_t:CDS:2 [Cetraspora pellucida]|uniref:21355_t:CDS:1 n=1 Tax=Cetraspora pellucida TaxID=1433469 RepID=A0A9N9DEQ3_9GLOM|nr:21355_t:CDS:2 [Cetraspora pellucida]